MAYLYLALAFSFNAAANILLKLGSLRGIQLQGSLMSIALANWQVLLGCVLFAVNIIFYFLALRALPLSTAYPIMVAMSFIIINSYAFFELKEGLALASVIGYVLIIAGLVLVVSRA